MEDRKGDMGIPKSYRGNLSAVSSLGVGAMESTVPAGQYDHDHDELS